MSRPLNQAQLLDAAQKQYQKLAAYLSALTPAQKAAAKAPQESVRDILAHLYEWQQMFFTWYEAGRGGEQPAVPAPGYKWSQMPALNQAIYEKYADLPLDDALAMLGASHVRTMQFIEKLSDSELTAPGLYPWMNQNTLMAYLNSITASHYVWALKQIKQSVSKD